MSLADANAQNRVFVKKAKCDGAADVYGCLLSLSTDQILAAIPWYRLHIPHAIDCCRRC